MDYQTQQAQKQKMNAHKEMLANAKRFAVACQREVRRNALASQKASRDTPGRARRLTREMLLYWKRYEKVEKEHRRRAEREAQEQLRIDIEMREVGGAPWHSHVLRLAPRPAAVVATSRPGQSGSENVARDHAFCTSQRFLSKVVGSSHGLGSALTARSIRRGRTRGETESKAVPGTNLQLAVLPDPLLRSSTFTPQCRACVVSSPALHYDVLGSFGRWELGRRDDGVARFWPELAKRQQRKLNFLITQTELYAHFMSRKMAGLGPDPRQEEILGSLDESASCSRSSSLLEAEADDDYDKELMKSQALRNAEDAYLAHRAKGMNWLYSLYDKGINGILADEMGLGKTVQTIAFLAALAEVQSIWGPFLVIAPASTLHNWQQEFTKFVPKFRVVPYWGNTSDRKVLRQFWGRLEGGQGSSFHVVVTSYQLVVQDVKYFQRIRWQYMVLDEAQAIKSTSSVRWKILLAFHCRNRLLLTGTPIQNTMAELWALLHFIMPTLFDSHDEFNEWFSKDIESHAENKSTIDEKHLSRLHMILKPFMLRRIKKDVENELSDKIEVQVTCWLAQRQKLLYQGLKNKISIEDLMQSAGAASSQAQSATSSLMNLVMQFRKVCNHPDLFERREVRSPFHMRAGPFQLPRLLFAQGILQSWNRRQSRWPSIFHPSHVHHSLFKSLDGRPTGGFSFSRFVGLSSSELAKVMLCGLLERFLAILAELKEAQRTHHTHVWRENQDSGRHLSHRSLLVTSHAPTGAASLSQSATLRGLVFGAEPRCYALETQRLHATRETAAHRELRQRKVKTRHHHHHHHHHHGGGGGGGTSAAPGAPAGAVTSHHGTTAPTTPSAKKAHHHQPQPPQQQQQQPPPQHQHGPASPPALPEFPHRPLPVQVLECVPTEVPRFLVSCTSPRVTAEPPELWCHSSGALWWWRGVQACGSPQAHRWWRTGQLPGAAAAQGAVFGPPPTPEGGLASARPLRGWSHICIPDKETLVTDSGKLQVLDSLLCRLKSEGHRVLIYSQMTRMIDLLEEYMWHRKHTYMRLDGSSKISDRRDMVADFQTRSDIFVFLLSTRAGGLGINLTAADTVVFYDSDWNPTVDQQAMDRAHRLGQTKQVTVYRLVCKGTIEERILQRAREKSEIQRMVISGGNFKPDTLKPKEVVSLLLDDAELERKFRQRQEERKQLEDGPEKQPKERKRRSDKGEKRGPRKKRTPVEHNTTIPSVSSAPPPSLALHQDTESVVSLDSVPPSPYSEQSLSSVAVAQDESSSEGPLIVDDGSPSATPVPTPATPDGGGTVSPGGSGKGRSGRGTGRARGRPRGSTRRAPAALRGSMLAAAERAGAQAGAQAGFAAYGYSVPWNGPPSGTAGGGPGAGGSAAAPAVRGGGGSANSFRGALQQQQGSNRSARQGHVSSGSSNAAT
ncbi:hypothetical protein HPB47_027316 [Ixodes persulcatus]|uniref:Uncharacterized protein n=1 Tax=Ixodes persulcatus TaxID=34615 RepID=A0AC60PWT8_IXOPE|nr:hypothetical protein HPB47_027316 [Ixodes persulcatus]